MRTALSLLVLLAGCATVAVAPEPSRQSIAFPEPTGPLPLPSSQDGEWTFDQLLREYGRVTNQNFLINDDTLNLLKYGKVPALQMVEVPPSSVHSIVESLLVEGGFRLTVVRPSNPRLVSVKSVNSSARNNIRSDAPYVPVEELEGWTDHPAYLIHTVLSLDRIDVRMLTNSMRAMITDHNLQSIVPAGSTNSMILTGTGPQVSQLVRVLQGVDEKERAQLEEALRTQREDGQGR